LIVGSVFMIFWSLHRSVRKFLLILDFCGLKVSSRYPDFKHKKTQKALWILDKRNPPWVDAKLAAMAPGTVQLSIFSWNAILAKYVKAGQYEKTMGLFHQLQQKGIVLNRSSFVPVLKASASLFALEVKNPLTSSRKWL